MSSRPLDELRRDAEKVLSSGHSQLFITVEELRMLKDYEQVVGTADKREAWWPSAYVYVTVVEEGR